MIPAVLNANRDEIIARTRAKLLVLPAPRPTDAAFQEGIPLFLDHLVETLENHASTPTPMRTTVVIDSKIASVRQLRACELVRH